MTSAPVVFTSGAPYSDSPCLYSSIMILFKNKFPSDERTSLFISRNVNDE
jgi:hypothetical protein